MDIIYMIHNIVNEINNRLIVITKITDKIEKIQIQNLYNFESLVKIIIYENYYDYLLNFINKMSMHGRIYVEKSITLE